MSKSDTDVASLFGAIVGKFISGFITGLGIGLALKVLGVI